jgi:hypothetical protein
MKTALVVCHLGDDTSTTAVCRLLMAINKTAGSMGIRPIDPTDPSDPSEKEI